MWDETGQTAGSGVFLLQEVLLGQLLMRGAAQGQHPALGGFHRRVQPLVVLGKQRERSSELGAELAAALQAALATAR